MSVVDSDEARERMRYLMAWLRRQLGQDDEARKVFQQIHDEGRASRYWADATYRLAQDALVHGDLPAAERWINEILQPGGFDEKHRIRPYALYMLARIAAQRYDWQAVLASLDDLQVAHGDSQLVTAARVWSVEALHRLGDYDNVLYRMTTLRESATPMKPAWQRLLDLRESQALVATDQWEQALRACSLAVRQRGS